MKQVSYKEYVITVVTTNENGTWRSHVIISWCAGKFGSHDEVCFTTEIEADPKAVAELIRKDIPKPVKPKISGMTTREIEVVVPAARQTDISRVVSFFNP
jgi:hypothetical protein